MNIQSFEPTTVVAVGYQNFIRRGGRNILQITRVISDHFEPSSLANRVAAFKRAKDLDGLSSFVKEVSAIRERSAKRILWDRRANIIDITAVLGLIKQQHGELQGEHVEVEEVPQKGETPERKHGLHPEAKVGVIKEADKDAANKQADKVLQELDKIIQEAQAAIVEIQKENEDKQARPDVKETSKAMRSPSVPHDKEKTRASVHASAKKDSNEQKKARERQIALEDQKREDTARVRKEEKAQLKKKIEKQEHRAEDRKADEKRYEERKQERKPKV